MDVHIPTLQEVFSLMAQFPAILVLMGGVVFGSGLTQLVKKTYVAFQPVPQVSPARFKASVRWLSALCTYLFTVALWHGMLPHQGSEEVIAMGTAFCSPLVYDGARALIAWKFPLFAQHWGAG